MYYGANWERPRIMTAVRVSDAKAHLSQLLDRAAAGEEIIISKAGRPMAWLVALRRRTTSRPLGLLHGQISMDDDFDAPLPYEMMCSFLGKTP